MLHGDPQTHLCWHAIAPALRRDFTVVLTDIRGRGEGRIAPATKDARLYSKRAMADEQVSVMQVLGFSRFSLVGHDRGARMARCMTLDHPRAVERLAVLDIVPALNLRELQC
jgi:haloacetate dehalogenase